MSEKIRAVVDQLFVYKRDLKGIKNLCLVMLFLFLFSSTVIMSIHEASATNVCPIEDATMFHSFTSETLKGDGFSSEDLKKYDVIVVDVWATDCFHCIGDMPMLASFSKSIPTIFPNDKVLLIGMVCDVYNSDGSYHENLLQLANDISNKSGVSYPQLVASPDMIKQLAPYVDGVPTVFYLDSEGNIIDTTAGLKESAYILKIKALLDEIGA